MCIEIYLCARSNENDLTITDSPSGFWSRKLAPGPLRIRALLESEIVYEIGSFMGCSCGLNFGPWSQHEAEEQHEKRVENVIAFFDLLQRHRSTIQRIMTLEQYHHSAMGEFPKHSLDQYADVSQKKEFSLDADCIYELAPGNSTPSIASQ